MKKFGFVLLAFLSLIGTACAASGNAETVRYKVTVTVETPEGIKTGSAVREAVTYSERSILPEQGGRFYNIAEGEAVVVDLGQRGRVFALMGGQGEAEDIFKMFFKKEENAKIILASDKYPRFTMFKDLNSPITVEEVCEKSACEKIQKVFHHSHETIDFDQLGIKIKEVSLEITQSPVTWEIDRQLPWLKEIKGRYLNGKSSGGGPALSSLLDSGYFQRGEKQ